ncbi:hypothetical protein PC117_g10382 [Phytophthora cactorum]|uniref:Ubiquitin-like protease family profile domain-containing protein n=1 Tax=Phytophthora cactorum TaxID=29920 RepID=A0A8T1DJ02_9STRA|nr:hypothetical protein PC117_g10382 [Phytophthora cactorum]
MECDAQINAWQANVLDLAAKECLTDDVIHLELLMRFGGDQNVVIFVTTTLGVVMDGQVEADKEAIRNEMAGLSEEKVLFPVNCNWNHWCFMVMNLEKGKMLISLLPNGARPSQCVQTYESGLGVQVNSYNCGVYVLLASKVFCGAEPLGRLDKKTLQCLRYRYLRMCMED